MRPLLLKSKNARSPMTDANCCTPGPAGIPGPVGPPGAQGPIGLTGPAGGVLGAAEFVRQTQSPNNSVPPGTAFTVDTQVFNTAGGAVVASAGAGGTTWSLNQVGTYVFTVGLSLGSAGSIALYKGATAGSLAIDNQTIAGSSTATTWISMTAAVVVSSAPVVVAVSSAVGTANVVASGTAAGFYTVRVNITRVA